MKNIDLNLLLKKPTLYWQRFHSRTKIIRLKNRSKLEYKNWPSSWKKIYFKSYPRLKHIQLPKPLLVKKTDLILSLVERKSTRNYRGNRKTDLATLSNLLHYSAGLRYFKNENDSRRFYPSAGGRYPIEVYLIALNTKLEKGIYHHNIKNHQLELIKTLNKFNYPLYFDQKFIARSSFLIVLTAVFKRIVIKYGERGYRHILIEAGHLGQNLYLLSTVLNLKCCAIGSYVDDKINDLLDINGIDESVIYILTFGR